MSKKNTPAERLYNGIVKENPTFVLTLGMCPTLAVTTSAVNGLGMGSVYDGSPDALCNLIDFRTAQDVIPDKVRIPAYHRRRCVAGYGMMLLLLQGIYSVPV